MRGVTRRAGAFDRFVAAMVAVTITGYWAPATMGATSQPQLAEIRGIVLAADGLTAIVGVSVKAANMQTRHVYTSPPTNENGTYRLDSLPPGSYDLAVETPQGLYAGDLLVDTSAGKRTMVSLALKPGVQQQGQEGQQDQPSEPPKGDDKKTEEGKKDEGKKEEQPAQPEPQQQSKKKKGGGFWRSPGGAAIAIVVGAVLVGAAANSAAGNSNEEPMTAH